MAAKRDADAMNASSGAFTCEMHSVTLTSGAPDEVSLLVVVVDTNPFVWGQRALQKVRFSFRATCAQSTHRY